MSSSLRYLTTKDLRLVCLTTVLIATLLGASLVVAVQTYVSGMGPRAQLMTALEAARIEMEINAGRHRAFIGPNKELKG